MRNAPTLALSALFFLFGCKNPGGDDSTSSSSTGDEPHCSEGYGDGPDVDPDYPPCGCDPETCENGGTCRVSGFSPAWTSSVCQPPCTCTDPGDVDGECADNDCPTMGDAPATCFDGVCVVFCDNQGCPPGYVCGDNSTCQVKLE